jgi:Fe-S-cluster-containing dehydrogenase component
MERNIFIFDQNKCVGCHACVVACMNENGFQSPDQWRNIHQSQEFHFPSLPLFYLSLACNHCEDAPCLKNCPALAYSRDEKTGAVIHHPEKCIGCKYCTWACPYDAPKFNSKTGIVEKCTFCNHRIEENLKPACANLCPVGALDFKYTRFFKRRIHRIESSSCKCWIGNKN